MEKVEHLLDGVRGIYLPQNFVKEFDLDKFEGITEQEIGTLANGPDDEGYWDAWTSVLDNATYEKNGVTFHLYQDGDLFGVAYDAMSEYEYEEFFGEERI